MENPLSTIAGTVLEVLYESAKLLPRPLETKYAWVKRVRNINRPRFDRSVRNLAKRGLVRVITKKGRKFIQLTKQGQLEFLIKKAIILPTSAWDGKWRIIMFDIPEDNKDQRQILRLMLKRRGFYKIQASVYIHPYPLNREAITYLKETKLLEFIRMLRVDEVDDDQDLRKRFKLI